MVATKTKPRKVRMIPGGGPVRQELKGESAKLQEAYEQKAKDALRAIIKDGGADYAKLQAGLRKLGIEITPAALENKIARGTFSAAFLIQCMDALGTKGLELGE